MLKDAEHEGGMMRSGAELARFGAAPVYLCCGFDDKLPGYEIHVSLNGGNHYFTTAEQILENAKD